MRDGWCGLAGPGPKQGESQTTNAGTVTSRPVRSAAGKAQRNGAAGTRAEQECEAKWEGSGGAAVEAELEYQKAAIRAGTRKAPFPCVWVGARNAVNAARWAKAWKDWRL